MSTAPAPGNGTTDNNQLRADGLAPIGFGAYLTTSDFAVDVTENWQSEYLQFLGGRRTPR